MLNRVLVKFLAKRAVVLLALLSIIDIVVIKSRWFTLVGLVTGTAFSVIKFGGYAWVFERIFAPDRDSPEQSAQSSLKLPVKRSIGVYLLNQLILLPLLFGAYYIDHWLFAGFVAGILTVPFLLLVYSLTGALGITKNHFE